MPTVAEAIDLVQGRVPGRQPITPCWSYAENDELWSRKHGTTGFNAQLVCLLDGAAICISDPPPGCTHDAKSISPPYRSPRLSRTPVAGSWIKAQRRQRWRKNLLCAATERETLRTRRCAATHGRPTLARWRGPSRTSTGQNATMLLLRGGVAVDRWERLRGGAFGFGLYKVRDAYASSSTTACRAMRATCSGLARSPRAARLASFATQRASAASMPPGLTERASYTAAARGIRAPTGPLVPRCVLPPDMHPVHPRLGQGRALGIPISGPHAVNLVNRWWQFHDTQLSSSVDAAFQALAIDEERSSFGLIPWTSDPRADQHVDQVWFAGVHSDVGGGYPDPALAEIALLWMADRARECGLVLQADAFPASPENVTQAPQDRMAPRRSQPAGNAAPIPHGLGSPAHPGAGHGRRQVRRPSRVRPSRESAAVEVYQKPHSLLRVHEEKAGRQLGEHPERRERLRNTKSLAKRPGQQARARAI